MQGFPCVSQCFIHVRWLLSVGSGLFSFLWSGDSGKGMEIGIWVGSMLQRFGGFPKWGGTPSHHGFKHWITLSHLDDLRYPYDLGNLHWPNDHGHWMPHLIAVKTIRFPAVKYGTVTVARTTTKRPMMCSTRSCFWSNTSSEVSNIHSDSPAINLPLCGVWWSREIHRVRFRDTATHLKPRNHRTRRI